MCTEHPHRFSRTAASEMIMGKARQVTALTTLQGNSKINWTLLVSLIQCTLQILNWFFSVTVIKFWPGMEDIFRTVPLRAECPRQRLGMVLWSSCYAQTVGTRQNKVDLLQAKLLKHWAITTWHHHTSQWPLNPTPGKPLKTHLLPDVSRSSKRSHIGLADITQGTTGYSQA